MKIAIVGTRNPGVSYQEWESILISKINASEFSLVISGGSKGIDTYAKLFAVRHHIPLMEHLPEYSKYGRKATFRRNSQIVREASIVIAFPSPDSKGTFHSIREAKRLSKQHIVVTIPSNAS
ncbi:MAG: DUF2493 domain-containing protein [Bacteroides sp.]|nr:DUF2493 domain-containing protein [Bacteroides sp.]